MAEPQTEEQKSTSENGEAPNQGALAAELRPTVEMTGHQRVQIIRVLNVYPKKGGVDAHEGLEDVMEALEQIGPGGPEADFWDWETFRVKGMNLQDARFNKTYPIRMRKKDWRRLVEDLRTIIEAAQEPFQVTRQLTKVYKAIQKVI